MNHRDARPSAATGRLSRTHKGSGAGLYCCFLSTLSHRTLIQTQPMLLFATCRWRAASERVTTPPMGTPARCRGTARVYCFTTDVHDVKNIHQRVLRIHSNAQQHWQFFQFFLEKRDVEMKRAPRQNVSPRSTIANSQFQFFNFFIFLKKGQSMFVDIFLQK